MHHCTSWLRTRGKGHVYQQYYGSHDPCNDNDDDDDGGDDDDDDTYGLFFH